MTTHPRKPKTAARDGQSARRHYVVCVNNEGYEASLEARKIYPVLRDAAAATHRLLRVVDESGEDYLYPAGRFAPITLSPNLAKALALAA